MSNARINIADQLAGIIAPNLDASNYAHQLNQVFTNIDNNFTKLANHDFIKGERGDSVKIQEVELISSTTDNSVANEYNEYNIDGLTRFGELLLNSIKNNFITDDTNSNILDIDIDENTKLNWLDNFKSNPGKLYMIYDATASNIDEDKAYSSLYYTFLDGRYANNTIGKLDPSNYQDVSDMSCIAIYDKDLDESTEGTLGFKIISNAFPTIYYEDGIGLCWKVNGNNTGIPVQGIKGKDGINSAIYIVSADLTESVNSSLAEGPVTGIFEPFTGYKNVNNTDISAYDNCTALVMTGNLNNDARTGGNGNEFYFGTLKTKTENDELKLFASCSPTTSITQSIGTESVINAMKNIDIFATGDAVDTIPRGLFVPISDETETKEQPVHLISATPISPEEGTISDVKTDVIFTPVNDYNSVRLRSESNEETAKNLKVDKYLYVQINKNHSLVKDNHITYNLWAEDHNNPTADKNFFIESFGDDNTDKRLKYDGVLKYKLDSIIKLEDNKENPSFDSEYLINTSNNGIYDSAFSANNGSGSITFGYDVMSKSSSSLLRFNPESVSYITKDGTQQTQYSTNHRDSIPAEFKDCNLYKWILCDEKHEKWDIEELTSTYTEDKYTFPDRLRVIYTKELTPSGTTKFLWFNGCNYYNNNYQSWFDSEFLDTRCVISDMNDPTDSIVSISNVSNGLLGYYPLSVIINKVDFRDINIGISNDNIDKKALNDFNNLYNYPIDEENIKVPNITENLGEDYKNLNKIIAGWEYCDFDDQPLFIFKKFIPIYNNDFRLEDDTALNLNYNINITGDANNPKKSITVHGNVNCDNINVHNLTSSGEIKNIFTKDIINSEKGLKLGIGNNAFCEITENSFNYNGLGSFAINNGDIKNLAADTVFLKNGIGVNNNGVITNVLNFVNNNEGDNNNPNLIDININSLNKISVNSNTISSDKRPNIYSNTIELYNTPLLNINTGNIITSIKDKSTIENFHTEYVKHTTSESYIPQNWSGSSKEALTLSLTSKYREENKGTSNTANVIEYLDTNADKSITYIEEGQQMLAYVINGDIDSNTNLIQLTPKLSLSYSITNTGEENNSNNIYHAFIHTTFDSIEQYKDASNHLDQYSLHTFDIYKPEKLPATGGFRIKMSDSVEYCLPILFTGSDIYQVGNNWATNCIFQSENPNYASCNILFAAYAESYNTNTKKATLRHLVDLKPIVLNGNTIMAPSGLKCVTFKNSVDQDGNIIPYSEEANRILNLKFRFSSSDSINIQKSMVSYDQGNLTGFVKIRILLKSANISVVACNYNRLTKTISDPLTSFASGNLRDLTGLAIFVPRPYNVISNGASSQYVANTLNDNNVGISMADTFKFSEPASVPSFICPYQFVKVLGDEDNQNGYNVEEADKINHICNDGFLANNGKFIYGISGSWNADGIPDLIFRTFKKNADGSDLSIANVLPEKYEAMGILPSNSNTSEFNISFLKLYKTIEDQQTVINKLNTIIARLNAVTTRLKALYPDDPTIGKWENI